MSQDSYVVTPFCPTNADEHEVIVMPQRSIDLRATLTRFGASPLDWLAATYRLRCYPGT